MLPTDSKERKTYPLYRGLWQYFPSALAAVAKVSHVGNEQHNPGQECFDNREKSNDDYDCMLRHLSEADRDDDDGLLHAAKVAWRALRACQKILEYRGAPEAPAARYTSPKAPGVDMNKHRPIPDTQRWSPGQRVRWVGDPTPTTGDVIRDDGPYRVMVNWHITDENGKNIITSPLDRFLENDDQSRMVPAVHAIGPEQQECENYVQNRIAGTTKQAQDIKNEYYGVTTEENL